MKLTIIQYFHDLQDFKVQIGDIKKEMKENKKNIFQTTSKLAREIQNLMKTKAKDDDEGNG